MDIDNQKIFHLYNRSNNREVIFKEAENYGYFMRKYATHLEPFFELLAFCQMPTHFHLLIHVRPDIDLDDARDRVGIWLSSYAKAVNKRYERNGSLFQQHSKAKLVDDESYLLNLVTYIHQNPVRAGLADAPIDWPYSSLHSMIKPSAKPKPIARFMSHPLGDVESFLALQSRKLPTIDPRYWV
jgi:putative transposase